MTVYTKNYAPPSVDEKEIFRYAGIAKSKEAPDELQKMLSLCLSQALPRLSYRVCYTSFPIIQKENTLDLGFTETESKALAKNLSGCEEIILFCATLGIELDRLIAKCTSLYPTKALFFQAIGAERVEKLCEEFISDLEKEYKAKGKILHPRFSPGFADFPLSYQKDIFAALSPHKHIGVTLGEYMLMSPTKSVTAIVGIEKKN